MTDKYGHTFAVITDFPNGYEVWNIGRANFPHEGYLPLCQTDGNYHIIPSTLKSLYVGDEDFCLRVMTEASRRGCNKTKYDRLKTPIDNERN